MFTTAPRRGAGRTLQHLLVYEPHSWKTTHRLFRQPSTLPWRTALFTPPPPLWLHRGSTRLAYLARMRAGAGTATPLPTSAHSPSRRQHPTPKPPYAATPSDGSRHDWFAGGHSALRASRKPLHHLRLPPPDAPARAASCDELHKAGEGRGLVPRGRRAPNVGSLPPPRTVPQTPRPTRGCLYPLLEGLLARMLGCLGT